MNIATTKKAPKSSSKKKVSKKKVSKRGKGQPTKWDDRLMEICKNLYLDGKTDKEVAIILGVTEQTINNWKNAQPHFFESLKDWKKLADEKVVRSLYERATGYTTKEVKIASHEGFICDVKEVDKHYPPDPTSMIFWLKNRQPDKWREKQEIDFNLGDAPSEELVEMAKIALVKLDENNSKKSTEE